MSRAARFGFAQIIFNIFRQKPIVSLFPHASEGGAIIVRLPLASGLLSGKINKDTKFAATDHRSYNRDGQQFNVGETFAGLPFEKGVEFAEDLKDFVPEALTMAQFAQRWILDHEEVCGYPRGHFGRPGPGQCEYLSCLS